MREEGILQRRVVPNLIRRKMRRKSDVNQASIRRKSGVNQAQIGCKSGVNQVGARRSPVLVPEHDARFDAAWGGVFTEATELYTCVDGPLHLLYTTQGVRGIDGSPVPPDILHLLYTCFAPGRRASPRGRRRSRRAAAPAGCGRPADTGGGVSIEYGYQSNIRTRIRSACACT